MLKRLKRFFSRHTRSFRSVALVLVLVLAGWLGWLWYRIDGSVVRTDPSAQTSDDVAVKFVPSPLTGVSVSEDLAKRPILAAQIENSLDARPQSGLDSAGVVFEAIAEGGITRFTALWQEQSPSVLGPIRSLRPYYIDWLLGFDAAVVHVGGSTQAKSLVSQLGVKSLDVSGAYYRADDRFAPHNAYASYGQLVDVMKRLKYYKTPDFTPLKRKAAEPAETPKASTIDVAISSSLFDVFYRYDKGCNCYSRNVGGAPHKDRESGQTLSPEVVVVLKMKHSVIDGVGHLGLSLVGSGEGWVFQDGNVTKVTWKKSSRSAQITFADSKGNAVGLNPGQTWITAIPTDKSVTYAP